MPSGGARSGAGRPKGAPNKASVARAAEIAASGETPLEFMLRVMRDPTKDYALQADMAKAAAPYVHPKLAAIEHTGKDGEALIPPPSDARETAKAVLAILGTAVAKPDGE